MKLRELEVFLAQEDLSPAQRSSLNALLAWGRLGNVSAAARKLRMDRGAVSRVVRGYRARRSSLAQFVRLECGRRGRPCDQKVVARVRAVADRHRAWSVRQVARAVGVSVARAGRILRGRRMRVAAETAVQVLDLLASRPDWSVKKLARAANVAVTVAGRVIARARGRPHRAVRRRASYLPV